MATSKSSKRDLISVSLALVWAIIIVASLVFSFTNRQVSFDPNQEIFGQFSSTDNYLDSLTKALVIEPNQNISVLRIEDAECSCNAGSQLHWQQLKKTYTSASFIELDIAELDPSLTSFVPSTPMAIVLDEQQRVLYAGPFSDSNYCSSDNSLIEAYLKSSLDMRYAPMETKGCYCQRK